MRDPRAFPRATWICAHALWALAGSLIVAWYFSPESTVRARGSFSAWSDMDNLAGMLLAAALLLGCVQQWVLRGKPSRWVLWSLVTGVGLPASVLVFAATFSACVGVFGEESAITVCLSGVAGGLCIGLAQALVLRPGFERLVRWLIVNAVGATTMIVLFLILTRAGDAGPAMRVFAAVIAWTAYAAITALCLPRIERQDSRSVTRPTPNAVGRQ